MFVLKGTALKACELCLLRRTLHLSNYKCKTKANPPGEGKKKGKKKVKLIDLSVPHTFNPCFSSYNFCHWAGFLGMVWFLVHLLGVTLWSLADFHCSIRVVLTLGASPGWAWVWGMPRLFPDLLLGQINCDRKCKWIPGDVAGRCQAHIKHAFVWEIADVYVFL